MSSLASVGLDRIRLDKVRLGWVSARMSPVPFFLLSSVYISMNNTPDG